MFELQAAVLSLPSESSDDEDNEKERDTVEEHLQSIEPAKQPQLFVMGFLQELRIFLSTTVYASEFLLFWIEYESINSRFRLYLCHILSCVSAI